MKTIFALLCFLTIPLLGFSQHNTTIYALNYGDTTNQVSKGGELNFNDLKPLPSGSFIEIKKKEDDLFYIKTTVGGRFAYGHYFKLLNYGREGYKYIRTDGDEIEYIVTNYPLEKLAASNKYDEAVVLKLINYRTSFAMILKF